MPVYLIIDLVILLILIFTAFGGYRKGFILTLCSFLAIFVAFFGARFLSDALYEPVSRLIQPGLQSSIQQLFFEELSGENALPNRHETLPDASLPDAPTDEMLDEVATMEDLLLVFKDNEYLHGFLESMQEKMSDTVGTAVTSATETVSRYLAQELARILLFIICFVLVLILWQLLSHTLNLAFKLPVLSTVNKVSGLILGLIKGMLFVFIGAWLLKGSLFSDAMIDNTILLAFFCGSSPLSLFTIFISA